MFRLLCTSLCLILPSTRVLADTLHIFCGLQAPKSTAHCPEVSEIKKNPTSQIWETKSGWKSTQTSISSQIESFLGASWSGWATGSVLCLYKPQGANEFPIAMKVNVTIMEPATEGKDVSPLFSQSRWKKQKTNGYKEKYNCLSPSSSVCDCPLEVYVEKQESIKQIIQSIERNPYQQQDYNPNASND